MSMLESRKNEVVYSTSDPSRMIDRYLVNNVYRTWNETFFDDDKGENISIERNELLFSKGTLITNDLIPKIRFFIEEGAIKELEVSNQRRMAYEWKNQVMYPYQSVVQIKDKKHRFLLYATSVGNALQVLADYIELNYEGKFNVIQIKEFENCTVIIDKLKDAKFDYGKAYCLGEITVQEYLEHLSKDVQDDESVNMVDMKWYKILSRVLYRDVDGYETEHTWLFVVKSSSAERANMLINVKVKMMYDERKKESEEKGKEFKCKDVNAVIEESSIIPVGCFIPKEFSEVYGE